MVWIMSEEIDGLTHGEKSEFANLEDMEDFFAGRITREEVERRLAAQRGKEKDDPPMTYYCVPKIDNTINIYPSAEDAANGTGAISLTSRGDGENWWPETLTDE
jgi:hypothetical protein